MKVILFFFLITLPTIALSQYYPDSNSYCKMVPYYDYAMCAKGLKDDSGKVLLEPRYSEIRLLPNDLILVCENDQYGVIDCDFNTILPIQYKKLHWMSKFQHVARAEQNYYWLFETDKGKGLMNSSLELIFPPKFDLIERVLLNVQKTSPNYTIHTRPIFTNKTAALFRLTENGKSGIYTELGERIGPNNYNEIECYGIKQPSSTPKLPFGIFFVAKDDSTQFILSEKGELLLKESLDVKLHVLSLDSSTVVQTIEQDGTRQTICLETGASLEKTKDRIYKDKLFLFKQSPDSKSFHVYGKNLEHLFTGEGWNPRSYLLSINAKDFPITVYGDKRTVLFSLEGEVMIHTDDLFYHIKSENGDYLWTVPENLEEKEDTLRVYFPSGEVKEKFVINGIGSMHFFKKHWSSGHEEELDELLFIKQGSKWGVLNRSGELIIPFQFDTCGTPYGSKYFSLGRLYNQVILGYHLSKKGKMGSIDRLGNELFACKYDTTFTAEIHVTDYGYFNTSNHPEYFKWEDDTYGTFAIRKNRLFTLDKGKERICDSSIMQFEGPLLLVGHALINYDGSVVRTIKDGEVHTTQHFFFHILGNVARVIKTNGEQGLTINRFKSAQVEGDYLKVKLTDETMGVISLDGSKWLYKPRYYDISFTKLTPEHAWVKADTLQTYMNYSLKMLITYDGRWMLVDTSYNQLYDFPFKTPVNLVYYPRAVFESEGRYGLIDTSLNVAFLPEYDLVYPIQYSEYVLLYQDSSWQLGHSSGARLPQSFSSISYQEVNKSMAVFSFTERDTLIGFVKFENGFKWLVPMTEMHELIAESSLRKAFGAESNLRFTAYGISPELDSLGVWRVQNNELLVSSALSNQCHIRMLPIVNPSFIPDFEFYEAQTGIPSKQFYDAPGIRSFGQYVKHIKSEFTYPLELIETQKVSYYPKCSWQRFHNGEILSLDIRANCVSDRYGQIFENYIYLDSVRLIELSDILKRDDKTSAFFRQFITNNLTTIQSGVEVCPDLDKSEEFMWSSFMFELGGIRFPDLELVLSYSELEPYLTDLGKRLSPW